MPDALHSNMLLNLQSSTLHAPTPPVMSATPPFLDAFMKVSHMGWLPPTVMAMAWHSLFLLYEHSVISHLVILGIVIAILFPSSAGNHPFFSKDARFKCSSCYFLRSIFLPGPDAVQLTLARVTKAVNGPTKNNRRR
jgi:hypothetical protein